MKIIGPRAIEGHRRQTRTERLHSAGQRGMASTAPLRKHKTGGRRASELRLGSSSERERQKAGLGAPAGTGAPLETWPCGYGLRLAPKSGSARKSWHNAKPPRKARPAREARNVHATSSSQWGQTTPIVGPAHALGTRREEWGASNTAIKEDLRLDSSFAEFFLEILRSVRVAMGES
jgi:hypothetical protein